MIPKTATPPATDSPIMVELETPEEPPPEGGGAAVCEGPDDPVDVSEAMTRLVKVWPPEFVVTNSEVCGGTEE